MSLKRVFARMKARIDAEAEDYGDGVRYWRGITVFEQLGHKLIVGDGFAWDAREEKLYGNPKPALAMFGGSEDNDRAVSNHYANIRRAVVRSDEDPDFLTNEQWELQKNDGGFVDVYSTTWNQVIAEVTPWGFVNLYIPKEDFLALPATLDELGEREKLLRKLDDLGYTEDEVRRILGSKNYEHESGF